MRVTREQVEQEARRDQDNGVWRPPIRFHQYYIEAWDDRLFEKVAGGRPPPRSKAA